MSTATTPKPDSQPHEAKTIASKGLWKAPIALGVITVALALLVLLGARDGDTTFRIAEKTDMFEVPALTVASTATVWITVLLCAALTALAAFRASAGRRGSVWQLAVYAVVAMFGFLAWAAAGETLPLVSLLAGSITLAIPLIFGALGGVMGERAGVVNIAIEGQLLFGAFAAAMIGTLTGSAWAGLLGAMIAGALVALVLAFFAITHIVEQVIVGVVLNVLVVGLTSFLFGQIMTDNPDKFNDPPSFARFEIPFLSEIPVLGPVFFRQTPLGYLMYVAVALIAWALYRTRWGLRVRAVGEHPKAADTVGIKVNRTRYTTVLLAGLVVGIGGATYTLVSVGQFGREMTGGAGYIALAAVIFGQWDPIKATLAALLFGFATNLSGVLSAVGSPVPSQFMLMLPYLVTLIAVAGLVGASRGPAAVGQPYVKG